MHWIQPVYQKKKTGANLNFSFLVLILLQGTVLRETKKWFRSSGEVSRFIDVLCLKNEWELSLTRGAFGFIMAKVSFSC